MPRFAWSRPPIAGESLLGFVARNADVHGVYGVAAALRPTGLSGAVTDYLATSHADKAQAIAHLFGTTVAEVLARMHPPAEVNGTPGEFVSFFGSPVRAVLLGFGRRRVSPCALSRSEHHRAIWNLKVLSFCPETRHELISTCPACRRPLGWRHTLGVGACETCGKDLTRLDGVPVRCDDFEALDFVADLLCHDPATRERARGRVPSRFAALESFEVFELVLSLARAILTPPDLTRLFTPRSEEEFSRLTPDVLAKAGRVVLDWPVGLHRLASKVRARATERPGFWGLKKEVAPLLLASRVRYMAQSARRLLREELDVDLASTSTAPRRVAQRIGSDLVTVTEACKEFGIWPSTLRRLRAEGQIWSSHNAEAKKSIVLVRRAEMRSMMEVRQDAVSRIDVAGLLGVDYLAVERLAERGHFQKIGPPAAVLLKGDNYRRSTVDAFVGRLRAKGVSQASHDGVWPTLGVAAATLVGSVIPWVAVVEAVLAGAVVIRHDTADARTPMASLHIRQAVDLAKAVEGAAPETLPDMRGRRMNVHEAAAIMEVTAPVLTTFIGTGLLPSDADEALKLHGDDVAWFRAAYVLTGEVSRRFGISRSEVKGALLRSCIQPVERSRSGKFLVWDRAEVDRRLGTVVPNPT